MGSRYLITSYPSASLTDAERINGAIEAVSLAGGGILDLMGLSFHLGWDKIVMQDNVILEASLATFTHSGLRAFEAIEKSGWQILGRPKFTGVLEDKLSYAFRVVECQDFYGEIEYYLGNAGVLLEDCVNGKFYMYGHEILGPNVAVKGPETDNIVVGSRVRNGAGFGVYGDNHANNVVVEFTDKWVDETALFASESVNCNLTDEIFESYKTPARVGTDMHLTLGEEALGLTYRTSGWTINKLYAHRSADAGCSLTGDNHHVIEARVIECNLGGLHSSGRNNQVDFVYGRFNGHYASSTNLIGGTTASFGSSAGNMALGSTFAKVVSVDELKAGVRIDDDFRYAEFDASGACGSRYTWWDDGIDEIHIFVVDAVDAPVSFGSDSPTDDKPAWNKENFSDGTNDWLYRSSYDRAHGAPIARDCEVEALDFYGPGEFVIDNTGGGHGNLFPSTKTYSGTPILINGGFVDCSAVTTMSSTPAEWTSGWFAARSIGGMEVTREMDGDYNGAKIVRVASATGTDAPFIAHSITGPELANLIGNKPSFKMRAWCGPEWSDNNGKFSWELRTLSSVTAFDADLNPGATLLSNNASATLTGSATEISFASSADVPDCAQLILRIYYTPTQNVGDVDDWFAISKPVCAPEGYEFSFADEPLAIIQARLA